jgi:hypothetical protein
VDTVLHSCQEITDRSDSADNPEEALLGAA